MKTIFASCLAIIAVVSSFDGACDAEPASAPPVTIVLGARRAHVSPAREGFTHTGGGNIDVAQPSPDTVIVTMTGVAVAGGHPFKPSAATMCFDLEQCLDITFAKPGAQHAKLTMEGRVIGLLRSHDKSGAAQEGPGNASVSCGPVPIANLALAPHAVCGGNNLSVNCRAEPVSETVGPGPHVLRQTWTVSASHPSCVLPCKAASSEFAPDPALDPLWISYWEPFHGANKKDFGFQVIIRVAPNGDVPANGK